ncbi:MAG: putative lipid II flippase FtsW [Deltaproteobacteria bacterium]|nr:putative lipid II flippase FtsW [Deltaproteobacteria bacterium]
MRALLARFVPALAPTDRPKVTGPADPVMTACVVALVAFGVVMVFSASAVFADSRYDDPFHFFIRQSVFALAGLGVCFTVARFDYHGYRRWTYPALAVAVVLLLMVVLGLGRAAGGAARWIAVGPINIQPAEAAKLALILWLAYSLSKKADQIRSFEIGFLPHALVAGMLMLLCLKQPDFGSAVMMGVLTFTLLFTAGARLGYLLGALAIAAPIAFAVVRFSGYRMDRIRAWLEPFEHRYGIGYQIAESLMSFGAGGATGVGIGDSRQKLLFLPEAHTDFISAIVGEELGFVGIALLLLAYVLLVFRGLRAAHQAADDYGAYLAIGITVFLGMQAFTNLAVAMGMLPTKGLVLPFMSYGGSSLLVNCAAVGILLNVSRPREVEELTEEAEAADAKNVPRKTREKRAKKTKDGSRGATRGRRKKRMNMRLEGAE